jgi:large subunit ribosomal protein L30
MAAKKETQTPTAKKPAAPKTAKKTAAAKTASAKTATAGKIRIQYYRSSIGFDVRQKRTVKGLGFGKLNSTRELSDTPALRGMIAKVPHLVRIVE